MEVGDENTWFTECLLQDNLNTSTAVGRFTMQILASLAEYNRNLILEGCKARIEAAKKRGVKFGRQEGTKMKKPKKEAVIQLYKAGTVVQQIMEITGIKAKQKIIIHKSLIEDLCLLSD